MGMRWSAGCLVTILRTLQLQFVKSTLADVCYFTSPFVTGSGSTHYEVEMAKLPFLGWIYAYLLYQLG